MATPNPGALLLVMMNHRKRLGVMDDHHIVILQVISYRIILDDGLIDFYLTVAQINLRTLEGVVHLLGDAEEIGRPVDDSPVGLDTQIVHQPR